MVVWPRCPHAKNAGFLAYCRPPGPLRSARAHTHTNTQQNSSKQLKLCAMNAVKRAGCITVRLEPLENRNSPRIPTKACPASHRCSLLGSGVIRGLKPPRPCIFPHVDFISCAWTALLGNQSITVRTVGVRGGVEQLQRSCTTSPKRPYHALE